MGDLLMTLSQSMKRSSSEVPYPLFLRTRMPEYAKAKSLRIGMCDCCLPKVGAKYLETLDWVSPAKLGGNQNELHLAIG